jgi:hypothetical protein
MLINRNSLFCLAEKGGELAMFFPLNSNNFPNSPFSIPFPTFNITSLLKESIDKTRTRLMKQCLLSFPVSSRSTRGSGQRQTIVEENHHHLYIDGTQFQSFMVSSVNKEMAGRR